MALVKFQPLPYSPFLQNGHHMTTQPAVNVVETASGFRLDLAAPGFSKADFQVRLENNRLTVSAKKEKAPEAEKGMSYRRREFDFSAFERSFQLPKSIDPHQVQASFNNGILSIELQRKPELQPVMKTVEVA